MFSSDASATLLNDSFDTNTTGNYTGFDVSTSGGFGSLSYDAGGRRMQLDTGDDVGFGVRRSVTPLSSGVFKVDFSPQVKHPSGGIVDIRLYAGADSYYRVSNTDGYGPRSIKKVVNGTTVDQVSFQNEYRQGNDYTVTVRFSPGQTSVEAFGETLVLTEGTDLVVSSFEVRLHQQDAYLDNIFYGEDTTPPDTTPPVWAGGAGICSAEDTGAGGGVKLKFDSATDAEDGSAVRYNVYYAPSASWNGSNWGSNKVLPDVNPVSASGCGSNAVTVTGLNNDTQYRFGIRAEDSKGNEDSNTNTSTATPTGTVAPGIDDTFDTNTTGNYTGFDISTSGGFGSLSYDASGRRMRMDTGNDVGFGIRRSVTPLSSGIFKIDFSPLVKHPSGGILDIRLQASDTTYYRVANTDGYGPRSIKKVVNGTTVDQASFQNEYAQGNDYTITVRFSPGQMSVEAFGETLVLSGDNQDLVVSSFEVRLHQQDAYLDNIVLSGGPFVFIHNLQNGHLQNTTDLLVQAHAANLESDWGVQFVLEDKTTNNRQTFDDFDAPYENTFSKELNGVANGDYIVEAVVIDLRRDPVSGTFVKDIRDPVGVGDTYVAFGDSISKGVGDDIQADNISQDMRINDGGYSAILSDALTAETGYPNAVVSGGEGGDQSIDGLARLPGLLNAFPYSQYYLVLFGTNDTRRSMPIPSGVDDNGNLLDPTDPDYPGTYLDNMQQIIDLLVENGKTPILSQVPITLGVCSDCEQFPDPDMADRNKEIQKMNKVIRELVKDNGIKVIPPDFYTYFRNNQDQFTDNLHPNGVGYQNMADLWFQALTAPPVPAP